MRYIALLWAVVIAAGVLTARALDDDVRDLRDKLIEIYSEEELNVSASFTHNGVTYTVNVSKTNTDGTPRPRAEVVAELVADVEALQEAVGYVPPS